MVNTQSLGIRRSIASRNAKGLISARPLLTEINYTDKFPKAKRGAKAEGLRFEKKVVARLSELYPAFVSGIAFRFKTNGQEKVCIPDGWLLADDGSIVVVEVKLRHTNDAWFQLRTLYEPVLRNAFGRKVRMLEVCKWYDPEVKWPEPHALVPDVNSFVSMGVELGCMYWGR